MFKGFDELFNDVIGLYNSQQEKAEYKSSLKNSIKMENKGLLKPDELPDKTTICFQLESPTR